MQATLVLERIERRVWQDREANVRWFLDGITHGPQTQTEPPHGRPLQVADAVSRFAAFRRGEWRFVVVEMAAVVGVHSESCRLGEFEVVTSCAGGVPSDSAPGHFDVLTRDLTCAVKSKLMELGFGGVETVPVIEAGED